MVMKARYLDFLIFGLLMLFVLPLSAQTEKEEVYETAYEMPRFPGCEKETMSLDQRKACSYKKLMEYVKENLKYPEEAKMNNVEGFVMVSFVVTKDGEIRDPHITKSLGHGCDEEAKRIVKSMNDMEKDWIPGINENGTPVAVRYNLPIQFRL